MEPILSVRFYNNNYGNNGNNVNYLNKILCLQPILTNKKNAEINLSNMHARFLEYGEITDCCCSIIYKESESVKKATLNSGFYFYNNEYISITKSKKNILN